MHLIINIITVTYCVFFARQTPEINDVINNMIEVREKNKSQINEPDVGIWLGS